ncbi:MAG: right-handed parallel beta-helix repeat-containing protein, partial [Candidatus Latescibacterota bacterium]
AGPVRYAAFPGERPRLLGGCVVPHLTPVEDASVRARLAPQARPHVLQCDLGSLGITDFGAFASRGFGRPTTPAHLEVFYGGRRLEVARWPNGGFATIEGPAEALPEGDGHGGALGRLEAGFLYTGDRPTRWASLDNVWLHGYWAWDWANSYERLAAFDASTGRITTAPPHGLYGIKAGQRFYFLNVLEELDHPGEYYVDPASGLLYLWPPADAQAAEVLVSVLAEPMVRVQGASHVSWEGMTLECTRGLGVHIEQGQRVTLAGCVLRSIGNHAVVVDGGTEHRVASCDIEGTGDGGIRISGGDRRTLAPSGHEVVNNHISRIGEWSRCYQPGVLVQGVGARVAHNLIHQAPHCAILLNGNEHVIELNHVHHVCQETGDVGAFYMGRDWTERGNVVRHNLFHHTHGYGMGSMAVYLDDCASGTVVYGNVFVGCTRAAFVGGGRNIRIENNVFVDCHPAVQVDGRGLDPRQVWRDMVQQTMRTRLEAMDPHAPPYATRYPELGELDRYYAAGSGVPPEGNLVTRNVCWQGEWLQVHWHAQPHMVAVQHNLVGEDPHFVDPEGGDFRLREDSPAWELGFRPIPCERIGLYLDAHRKVLPPANAWQAATEQGGAATASGPVAHNARPA